MYLLGPNLWAMLVVLRSSWSAPVLSTLPECGWEGGCMLTHSVMQIFHQHWMLCLPNGAGIHASKPLGVTEREREETLQNDAWDTAQVGDKTDECCPASRGSARLGSMSVLIRIWIMRFIWCLGWSVLKASIAISQLMSNNIKGLSCVSMAAHWQPLILNGAECV